MKLKHRIVSSILLALIIINPVHAYIGPGAGIPILGSIIGIIVTVLLVLSAILFWPIKKLLLKRKNDKDSE